MDNKNLLKKYFFELSEIFQIYFDNPKTNSLPFDKNKTDWLNYFYKSSLFRHIHLEYYNTQKISVLHINMFPDPRVDIPILGFDIICIGDKITGLFFDFTPTTKVYKDLENSLIFLKQNIKSPSRELPEWATFFSKNFICITPLEEELPVLLDSIKDCITNYLQIVAILKTYYNTNIKFQNTYCQNQKKNEKTLKALTVEIGKENAQMFLNNYLFPEIIDFM